MNNMFFRLDSGQIVNLQKLQLIEKHRIWFEYDPIDCHGLDISIGDYERIQRILNPDWTDIDAAMDWVSKETERKSKE